MTPSTRALRLAACLAVLTAAPFISARAQQTVDPAKQASESAAAAKKKAGAKTADPAMVHGFKTGKPGEKPAEKAAPIEKPVKKAVEMAPAPAAEKPYRNKYQPPPKATLPKETAPVAAPSTAASRPSGKQPVAPVAIGKMPIPEGKAPVVIPEAKNGWLSSLNVGLGLDSSLIYDDNLFLDPSNKTEDTAFRLEPRITVHTGDYDAKKNSYLAARYMPQWNYFLDNSGESRFDQDVLADLQYRLQRLTLGAFTRYRTLSEPNADVATRFDRSKWNNALRAAYSVSSKTNLEAGFRTLRVRHDGDALLIDSDEWAVDGLIEYVFSEKTRLGFGYEYGELDVDGSTADQRFHRPIGRFLWYPTGKVSLELRGGIDFRDLPRGNTSSGIYEANVQWNPRPTTATQLTSYRRISPSEFFRDQNITTTGVTFKLDQLIGRRFYAGFETGFERARYSSVTGEESIDRDDEYFLIRPWVGYSFDDWIRLEVFYRYRTSDSTLDAFSYDNNQFGTTLSMDF